MTKRLAVLAIITSISGSVAAGTWCQGGISEIRINVDPANGPKINSTSVRCGQVSMQIGLTIKKRKFSLWH
jgi:hypothetical protein